MCLMSELFGRTGTTVYGLLYQGDHVNIDDGQVRCIGDIVLHTRGDEIFISAVIANVPIFSVTAAL